MRIKKDSEKEEKRDQRLQKFNHAIKRSEADESKKDNNLRSKNKRDEGSDLADKPQKTTFEKLKSLLSFYSEKTIEDNQRLRKIKHGYKRSKNEIKERGKSLRQCIKQNRKWVIIVFVIYIIVFGAVVSTPVIVNHLKNISQNETKQERFCYFKNSSENLQPDFNRFIVIIHCIIQLCRLYNCVLTIEII